MAYCLIFNGPMGAPHVKASISSVAATGIPSHHCCCCLLLVSLPPAPRPRVTTASTSFSPQCWCFLWSLLVPSNFYACFPLLLLIFFFSFSSQPISLWLGQYGPTPSVDMAIFCRYCMVRPSVSIGIWLGFKTLVTII